MLDIPPRHVQPKGWKNHIVVEEEDWVDYDKSKELAGAKGPGYSVIRGRCQKKTLWQTASSQRDEATRCSMILIMQNEVVQIGGSF